MKYFEQLLDQLLKNSTKVYLISANIILVVFAIWFSNAGLLPFKNFGDFAFFAVLALILGLYRPSWTFAFFVGTIALENVNLAPTSLGVSLRPYQFFGFITMIAILVQFVSKRLVFPLPKFRWFDALPLLFALGGFLSALGAVNKVMSLKQAVIALTFVALYFLVRTYVQSLEDLKRMTPFFLSSSLVVMLYSIWQNVRFLNGVNSFEVMPGRPNGTFTEADWLGVFLVFVLAVIFAMIYKYTCHSERIRQQAEKSKNPELNIASCNLTGSFVSLRMTAVYLFLTLIFVSLILTVSRSAWIGAVVVAVGFLKFVLYDGTWKFSEWQWKKMFVEFGKMILVLFLSIVIVQIFHLTNFQLGNRAASTGGLQKITISCGSQNNVPEKIETIEVLAQYGCKHINLEEIASEKEDGRSVQEIFRPDPNVNIRAEIYGKSIEQIKQNPILGIGWGSISEILGTDERGAGLNASNIFLEVWLGSGLLGILAMLILLGYIAVRGAAMFFKQNEELKIISAFVLLGLTAIVVPNLFNSGIFLGFVWMYLGAAVSLLDEKNI